MKFFLVLATVAFLAVSESHGTFVKREVSMFKGIRDHVQNMAQQLTDVTVGFKSAMDNLAQKGSNHISQPVDDALFMLKYHPVECTVGVEENLKEIKRSKISSFFHCSNLTDALVETGSIVFKTLQLTSDIVLSVNDLLQLSVSCNSWNPYKFVKCWINKISTIEEDIKKDTKAVEDYITDVKRLSKEIKANIEYCTAPHTLAAHKAVNLVMGKVHECTAKSK